MGMVRAPGGLTVGTGVLIRFRYRLDVGHHRSGGAIDRDHIDQLDDVHLVDDHVNFDHLDHLDQFDIDNDDTACDRDHRGACDRSVGSRT